MVNRYSKIFIRKSSKSKRVRIGSKLKPRIVKDLVAKWQSLINLAAKIANVPAGLIMLLHENSIEVFISSKTEGNPYYDGEKADLFYGLYCETVIGTQQKLMVPNAKTDPLWKDNNPDVNINMVSYMGFPINWPDKEVFGTVCLLDNNENHYNKDYEDLLYSVKEHIETDLKLLLSKRKISEKSKSLEQLSDTQTKFLTLISHDIRGNIGTLDEFLKLIISEFDELDIKTLKENIIALSESANSTFLILESLLNWSKHDLLQLKPEAKNVDLCEILNQVIELCKQRILFKKIHLSKEFRVEKAFVKADENMLATSFRNILSNSVKYSNPNGQIFVRIYEVNNQYTIEIEDTGIGMSQKAIELLFTSKSMNLEGTRGEKSNGIGLILTKSFLDKNNASTDVTSELGKGTKFSINFRKLEQQN